MPVLTSSPARPRIDPLLHAAFPVRGLPIDLEIARLCLRLKRTAGAGATAIDRAMPVMPLPQQGFVRMTGWP